MDPAGSWAYTYNRIGVSGVSTTLPTTSSNDFNQHNLTTVAGQGVAGTSPTPSTILLHTSSTSGNSGSSYTSGGFISSSAASYEPVFNSIFQQTVPKSAQYNSPVNPNRQNLNAVQVTVSAPDKTGSPRQNFSNHGQQQPNFYTEQSTSGTSSPTTNLASGATLTWQGGNASHITIGDPFSLLSQENIVQTESPDSSGHQNTYTSQYQTPQTHLNQVKISRRSISPQIGGTKKTIQPVPSPITTVSVASSGVQTPTQYYRHPTSISSTYSDSSAQTGIIANTSKSHSGINQTCLLVSSAVPSASNQNVTNQKYTKKQNMYNNAGRSNVAKNSSIAATITPSNMVANVANNNGHNHSFGIPTSAVKTNNQTLHLVQTKAQTKIYPELLFVEEQGKTKLAEIQQTDSQDSSISYYTIIDGRLAYASGNTNLIINESPKGRSVNNIQSPRQFILSNSADIITSDGSRIKTEPNYAISPFQSECTNAIIVPRKQSPSHSTSSQAASPAYPIYNSPMNSVESPSQHSASSCATHSSSENSGHLVIYKPNNTNQEEIAIPTIDAPSVAPRNVSNNSLTNTSGPVVYSSVITRALVNDQGKVYSSQQTCWDTDIKPKKFYTINSGSQNEIVLPAEIQLKSAYYENASNNTHIGALHGLKTEESQITENILVTTDNPLAAQIQITQKIEEPPQPPPLQPAPPPKSRRRRAQNSTKTREQLLSENEFLINRVPPRIKNTKKNAVANENSGTLSIVQTQPIQSISQHQQNGGAYYDGNWNAHQGVTQQVVFTGSSNTPNQIASYGEQQQLQQQYQHTPHLQQQQSQSLQGQQQLQQHQHQSQQHQQQQQQPQQHQQQQHQQQPQHQQFQQPQQQVLLTHQSSHHVQYPAQNPYYNSYQISSNVSEPLIENQNSGTTEVPINLPEPYKTPTILPKQEIITENTPNPSNSEAGSNDTNPDKQESNRQEEPGLKVVVPNIEEELDFLCSGAVESGKIIKEKKALGVTPILKSSSQACEPFKGKTFKVPNSAATGFMASYLKFLQGERDSSPPPIGKPQRNPIFQKTVQPIPTNSSMLQSQTLKSSSQTISSGKAINEIIKKPSTTVVSVTDSVMSTGNLSQQLSPLKQVLPVPSQHHVHTVVSPQQQTSVICQEPSSKSIAMVTTNFASTQTVNKKRKAITAEYDKEQNKQKKGNKVKNVSEIAVQTASHPVMLPKKARPQMAMQMASMQLQNKPTTVVPLVNQQLPPTSMLENQDQLIIVNKLLDHSAKKVAPTHRYQQPGEEDPLNLPPRRETSLRKAKTRGIEEIMQKKGDTEDHEEPQEFADSDTDPVWTPEDEENEINKTGKLTKRKCKRPKISYSRSRKPCSNILTAAVMDAGIDDSDADNALHDVNKRIDETQGNTKKQINSPKCMKKEAIKAQESTLTLLNTTDTTSIVEAYRTGDFVILRSDLVKDWPVLWQVDGKSILQMFESFPKDGKVLYKNMSKYAAWSNESKRLYVRAPITIQSQSQNEIVVELKKSELYGSEAEQYVQKLMIDYLAYRENFDVYVQTLISQSLDQNFFTEITKEKDEYFLSNIKIIEDIMENCARKLLQITHIAKNVIVSIKTWPHYNSIADVRHSSLNQTFCVGCNHPGATMRFLLYGQPYKSTTMQPMEMDKTIKSESDIMFCQSCESRAKLLHKIVHEKYNLYQICSRKVQDQQIIDPEKGTTAILNDLLADNDWIDQLFSKVRSSWVEVESIQRIVRFYQVSQ